MLNKQNEVFSDLTDLQKGGEQLKMGWFSGCPNAALHDAFQRLRHDDPIQPVCIAQTEW